MHALMLGCARVQLQAQEAELSYKDEDEGGVLPPPARTRTATAAAEKAAEAELAAAVRAGRRSFALLQRYGHTAVASGVVAIVFGGMYAGAASASLISVRDRAE